MFRNGLLRSLQQLVSETKNEYTGEKDTHDDGHAYPVIYNVMEHSPLQLLWAL